MPTARDVILETLFNRFGALAQVEGNDADRVISALLSAPDLEPHPELAAKLNPWRGIETAPKDGNWILGHVKGPLVTAYPMFWSGKAWIDGDPESDPYRATHWLPLPAPPSEDKP